MTDLTRSGTHCSKCGGEKDSEGWCPNYCMDDDESEVRVENAGLANKYNFYDLSEKHLAEELTAALRANTREET